MILNEPYLDIVEVVTTSGEELGKTFMRFQEHYESPKFRGEVFSREEFKEWYTKNSPSGIEKGTFTYYDDWAGFNFPSSNLAKFYDGSFNPLSQNEETLLETLSSKWASGKDFYVLGLAAEDEGGYQSHEFAHALYYLDSSYYDKSQKIVNSIDETLRNKMSEILIPKGYIPEVIEDEIQAYLINGIEYLKLGDDVLAEIEPSRVILQNLLEEHLNLRKLS